MRYGPEVPQKSCGEGREPRSLRPLSACSLSFGHGCNTPFTSFSSLGLTVLAVFEEERRGENSTALGGTCLGLASSSRRTKEPSVQTHLGLSHLSLGCCRAAFPHSRLLLGGRPTPFLGEAEQMHRGDDICPLNVSVLVFVPRPDGCPAAGERSQHPLPADMKLNPADQLLNGFLSDKVRSCLDVQVHMTPPHFHREEITLQSASCDLINQINLSQE